MLVGATEFGPKKLEEKSHQVSAALNEYWKKASDKTEAGVVLDAFGAMKKTAQHAFKLRDECQQLRVKNDALVEQVAQLRNAHEDKADMAEMTEDLAQKVRALQADKDELTRDRDEARGQVARLQQAQEMLDRDLSAPAPSHTAAHEQPRVASKLESFFKGMLPVPGTQTLVV